MRNRKGPETIDLDQSEAENLIKRAQSNKLTKSDLDIFVKLIRIYMWLQFSFKEAKITMVRLRKWLFGEKTEKKKKKTDSNSGSNNSDGVTNQDNMNSSSDEDKKSPEDKNSTQSKSSEENQKSKGHGRLGVSAYTGAEHIECSHTDHKAGELCPLCERGHLYHFPCKNEIRLTGNALVSAIIFELAGLRCSGCGAIFYADMPEDASTEKYDVRVKAVIAVSHYAMGMPFYRIERLQEMVGVPLPDATQWDLVEQLANDIYRVFEQLKWELAQRELIYQDDTRNRILSQIKENKSKDPPQRKGIQTTILVSLGKNPISIFLSGRQHAGENLDDILDLRDPNLPPIMQMCDGLSANNPSRHKTVQCNCMVHARRQFFEIDSYYPQESGFVIAVLAEVYHDDEQAKKLNLTPEERLSYHQKNSMPLMSALKQWLEIMKKFHEDNSNMGKAIKYSLKRWEKLTRFLTIAGAPLDNNTAEQIVKRLVLYRKNSLFYANEHGAYIGDMYMSLIDTCQLNKVNPIPYFIVLSAHEKEVKANPSAWLPWNYQDNLQTSIDSAPVFRDTGLSGVTIE